MKASGLWRVFRTAHCKVDEFRSDRARQPDETFVAECEVPIDADSAHIVVAVRRAVASVGLIDPLFIRAADRYPEELGVLPLWDSLDWMSFVIELERELGKPFSYPLANWSHRGSFSVAQLARAVCEEATSRAGS